MPNKTLQDPAPADPRKQETKPESQSKQEKIPHPGLTEQMAVKPDHGEESYRGSGRLERRTALITGADRAGSGRRLLLPLRAKEPM